MTTCSSILGIENVGEPRPSTTVDEVGADTGAEVEAGGAWRMPRHKKSAIITMMCGKSVTRIRNEERQGPCQHAWKEVFRPVLAGLTASAKASASPPKLRAKAEALRHVVVNRLQRVYVIPLSVVS